MKILRPQKYKNQANKSQVAEIPKLPNANCQASRLPYFAWTYSQDYEDRLKRGKAKIHMRSACITYAVCKYVTLRTFNVLNVFVAVQQRRQVNLII